MSAVYEPARAMLRLTPNANPSCRPTNHCPIATVIATIIDSAPRPKISRPAAIAGKFGAIAVTTAPTREITANASVDNRVPYRSTMIPPTSTMMMFGRL